MSFSRDQDLHTVVVLASRSVLVYLSKLRGILFFLQISHTFQNYPAGVRYIWFQHGGQDTQFWAGWYGIRVTNSSITIGPLTLLWRHNISVCFYLRTVTRWSQVHLFVCTLCVSVLALSCAADLKYKQLVLLVHSRTAAGPALWKDFCLHLSSSCTVDVTAITSALPWEED